MTVLFCCWHIFGPSSHLNNCAFNTLKRFKCLLLLCSVSDSYPWSGSKAQKFAESSLTCSLRKKNEHFVGRLKAVFFGRRKATSTDQFIRWCCCRYCSCCFYRCCSSGRDAHDVGLSNPNLWSWLTNLSGNG